MVIMTSDKAFSGMRLPVTIATTMWTFATLLCTRQISPMSNGISKENPHFILC